MSPNPADSEEQWLRDLESEPELIKTLVDDILQACPKFRILILGRSGVGKSHLVNAVFGTIDTTVEHGRKAGDSDIEKEFTSPQNPRLILHDSRGFSHGSGDNFNKVKEFIKTRSQCANLTDRLHAIWLCSAVPTYGGSLLEVGEEEILQMKDYSSFAVPIMAVFTKYDELVKYLMPQENEEDLYGGDIMEDIKNLEEEDDHDMDLNTETSTFQINPHVLSLAEKKLCELIAPFKEQLRVPWVKVSVKPGFSDTLVELVDQTKQRINNALEVLWASTQQESVGPKIDASINVGKKRYWRVLSTSFKLASGGKSLENWFKVIHRDIVAIWGITNNDPNSEMVLNSAAKVMSELQEELVFDIGAESERSTQNILGISAIPGIAHGVTAVLHVSDHVAFPLAAGMVLAAWVYKVVSVTPNILRGMMGYIVDFTIVMQSLFFLIQARTDASGTRSPVSERLFNVALDAYKQDTEHSLRKVHDEIREFATMKKAIFKSKQVIKEVERLINDHRFKPSERFVEQARANIPN